MTRLYVVRHCEAMGNAQRLFQGSTDCDISEIGAVQLRYLSARFRDIPIDAVYASPLIRAQKTAHAIADGKGLPVEVRDGLTEIHGGIVEGRPVAETFGRDPVLLDTWNNHPQDFAPEGGEPMRHVYERVYHAVLDIVKHNPGRTVAIASHGAAIRCLICRVMKGDIVYLKDIPFTENTSVSLIEFDAELQPTLRFYNDVSHVPEKYLPKNARISDFFKQEQKK